MTSLLLSPKTQLDFDHRCGMEEITLPTPPAVSREWFQSVQSVNFSGGKVEGQLWHPKAEGAANANLLFALIYRPCLLCQCPVWTLDLPELDAPLQSRMKVKDDHWETTITYASVKSLSFPLIRCPTSQPKVNGLHQNASLQICSESDHHSSSQHSPRALRYCYT